MASAEREPIAGVLGRATSGRIGSGELEAESFLAFESSTERQNLPYSR